MTFKEVQRLFESQPDYYSSQQSDVLDRLRGKAFWYWEHTRHNYTDRLSRGSCCFNHIIGLPTKDGKEKPMFDYEREIYFALTKPGYLNSNPKSHSGDRR